MTDRTRTTEAPFDAALERFKASRDAWDKQRDREREDLAFQVPELQWDTASRLARDGTTVNGMVVPARPTLSIPKLDQPIQLILNQQKSAHLGIEIHPVSETANADTARMLQGLYRHLERDSRAQLARGWAFDRAVKSGMGFYRVNTVYDDESGNPFDQKIVLERLLYQDMVFLDPSAQLPDWSDGEYAFIAQWMTMDQYERTYKDSRLAGYDADALRALVQDIPEWVRLDGPKKNAVLVAEYFRKEYRDRVWVQTVDGGFAYLDELADDTQVLTDGRRRTVKCPVVMWSVINGIEEVTTPQEWNGKYIPIIPVLGRELQPFDNERRFVGMVRPARDGQRLYNYAASNSVEIAATEPHAPWLMYEGQDEGYESLWAQANVRNFPVLKVRNVSIGGQPAPLPQRVPIDGTRLTVSMQLLQQADQYIQASTAVFDPSLGRANSDRSGRAVLALQQQSDAGNSHYLDALANIAMTYEAKVVLDLIPHVFDRPGRVVHLLTGEDEQQQALVNAPYTIDARTKRAQPAPGMPMASRGMPGGLPPGPPMGGGAPAVGMGALQAAGAGAVGPPPGQAPPPTREVLHHDLQQGTYGVSVTVGRSFQTRLDEGASEIGQILSASPGLMPLIGPVYFKYRDFPGASEIADLLKKQRDQLFPGLDGQGAAPSPAQQQQQQQQLEQLQQQLQHAVAYIKGEQAKQEATVAMDRAKAETQLQLQTMKDATAIEIAKIQALTRGVLLDGQLQNEALALQHGAQVAQQRQQGDQAHELGMAGLRAQQAQQAPPEVAESPAGEAQEPPGFEPGEAPPMAGAVPLTRNQGVPPMAGAPQE